jgi:hypothetical protein
MNAFIFVILLFPIYIFAVDQLFRFPDASIPAKVEYEKKRTLCIFGFRKDSQIELDYLSNGISEVVYSSLSGFHFVYDENPLPMVVTHPYGKKVAEKKKLEKDHRFISLELKLLTEHSPSQGSAVQMGLKHNCSYILTGEYRENGTDALKTFFELTNRKTGQVDRFTMDTTIRRAFQEIQSKSGEIKSRLLGSGSAGIKIQTPELSGGFVYIDDEYIGKTPIERNDLIPGRHRILIIQEGYIRKEILVELEKNKIASYTIPLEKEKVEGLISVRSVPQGAEVFLGGKSLGFTPIEKVQVPVGQNRLRLILENHIDHFQGVDIPKNKEEVFSIALMEGDTETYYKNRLKLFQDYTYFDFSLFSLYGSVVFYVSYMYAGMRSSVDQDRLQSFAKYTDFTTLQAVQTLYEKSGSGDADLGLYQNGLALELLYQQSQVNKTMKNVERYERIQNMSVIGAASMLVSAGLFYFWGIESDAIEFGWKPSYYPTESSESYLKINFRF